MTNYKPTDSRHDQLLELQERVSDWSYENFGQQLSKYDNVLNRHLNPLIGLNEEYFELVNSTSVSERNDAIGDIIIYLCDFTARLDIDLVVKVVEVKQNSLEYAMEQINHITLKMHQGIRGYDDVDFARSELLYYCQLLLASLYSFHVDPIQLAVKTFNNIVSKRDWVSNPVTGEKE